MAVVLFAFAHPDDETLGAGVAIVEHVAAGHEVHVLILTRGTASVVQGQLAGAGVSSWWAVIHDPAAEGYTPPDPARFGALRIAEAETALDCLTSGIGSVTLHEAGLLDGAVTQADAQAAILAVADIVNPDGAVWLKGHTHLVDDNPDHTNTGRALRALATADPTRFSNLRHYVLPRYWSDSRLSQVAEAWDTPSSGGVGARARNACSAYGAWAPFASSFAIGYHSVYADMFAPLLANPRCMYHP